MEHEDDHLSTKVVEPNDDNAAELAPLHQVGCKFNEEDVEIHQNSCKKLSVIVCYYI